jgi:hypothetical protein
VNGELERMWKDAVVAYFRALSLHLPGGTEENHEKTHLLRYSAVYSR